MTRTFATAAAASLLTALALTLDIGAHWKPGLHNREHAIHTAWCGTSKPCAAGRTAIRVAKCESGWSLAVYAGNGIYKGMFQVSPHWRATVPGWAWNPWAQARHAHRVYKLTGGWSHWSCAYLVGVL